MRSGPMPRCALILMTLLVASCAATPERPRKADRTFDIPIVMNDSVETWLNYFQDGGRERFTLFLERSHKYIPMMRQILREQNLPEDLVYLAMIESGFNPHAYSRARATGPWQFMARTGKRYGLKINSWVDERRDPEKSTVAAAAYLKDLFDQFNDWYLAAAGYNAGEGKIHRAIRRYDTTDFWEMTKHRYLKRETRNYVPKLIAAALISKNPEQYGFINLNYEEPLNHDKIVVDRMIDLRVVARLAGSSYEEIKALNPSLKLWITPPDDPAFELNLPHGTARLFEKQVAGLNSEERLEGEAYTVQGGEAIQQIAKRHRLHASHLRLVNGLSERQNPAPGQNLVLPAPPPEGEKWAFRDLESVEGIYIVRAGDSLWTIARRHRVGIANLKEWNPNLQRTRTLHPGQKIRIVAQNI